MEDKHRKELQCFQRAVDVALKRRGETKRIMKYLAGEDIHREEEERPDIVKVCRTGGRGQKDNIVGIEHFRVDHLSLKKKNDKIASTGVATERDVHRIFNTWHQEVTETNEVPEEAVMEIFRGVSDQIERMEKATYHTYIAAFEYSLEQHLRSIDIYRKNLSKIAGRKYNTQLALFIEIHMEFNNLYLNEKSGNAKSSKGQFPMFGEIVRMLEKRIDKKKVDYIVFCMGNTLYNEHINVIAVRTGNIAKNLERQGVRIYEYAGEDILLSDFQSVHRNIKVTPQCTFKEERVDVNFQYVADILNENQQLQLMFYSFKRAWQLKRCGYHYATTVGVQMLMEIFGDFVIGWKKADSDKTSWKVEPILSPLAFNDWEKRMDEFEKRWFSGKID